MADIKRTIEEFQRWIDWMDEDAPVIALDAIELLKKLQDDNKRLDRENQMLVEQMARMNEAVHGMSKTEG